MGHLNIEFKANTEKQEEQEELIKNMNAIYAGEDRQTDTYFNVPVGRLKLREGNVENSLIFYIREDAAGIKDSNVQLCVLEKKDPALKALLTAAHGIKVVVEKTRRIYFIENVKFHFDEIAGLGKFVEVEAIDKIGEIGRETLQKQCDKYAAMLGVKQEDYKSESYSDMIIAHSTTS